jgi:hypothetical protein
VVITTEYDLLGKGMDGDHKCWFLTCLFYVCFMICNKEGGRDLVAKRSVNTG